MKSPCINSAREGSSAFRNKSSWETLPVLLAASLCLCTPPAAPAAQVSATRTISGRVSVGSTRLSGVTLDFGGQYTAVTDKNGSYSQSVTNGWSGRVTPTKLGYQLDPPYRDYVKVTSNKINQNYSGTGPTVSITWPSSGASFGEAAITATGTAHGFVPLTDVRYQLNNNSWQIASGSTNWQAALNLVLGINTLRVYCTDIVGNLAPTKRVTFTHGNGNRLVLQTTTGGKVVPNDDGVALTTGASYTLTAIPARGYVFSYWTGGITDTAARLKFVMRSDLVLVANFIPNPFTAVAGTYNGLFPSAGGVAGQPSGAFTLTVTGNGAVSGRLWMGGTSASVSGKFAVDGSFEKRFPSSGGGAVDVSLQLDLGGSGQITGSVGNSAGTTALTGYRAASSPVLQAGQYTLAISGSQNSTNQPGGYGFGAVSVHASGRVGFVGTLGDGTKMTQRTLLCSQGQWGLYAPLYSGAGSISGWLTFVSQSDSDLSGEVTWTKPAQPGAALYPAGFTVQAEAAGAAYTARLPALNLTEGLLVLQGGSPSQSITNAVSFGANNQVIGANGLSLKVTTASGLFKGSVPGSGGEPIPVSGALLQKRNAGYGFFLGTHQSGAVLLLPQ